MSYRSRQLVFAALAANAVRPVRSRYGAVPAFFAGWVASELAPQWLAVTAADAAAELTVRRRRERAPRQGRPGPGRQPPARPSAG